MEDAVRYAIKTVTAQCVPVRMVLNLVQMESPALKVPVYKLLEGYLFIGCRVLNPLFNFEIVFIYSSPM